MKLKNRKRGRIGSALSFLLVAGLLVATASCKRTAETNGNANGSNTNSTVTADQTSSTPPFPTKEPERYQATMVTSGSGGSQSASIPGLSALTNQQMSVARDGDKRRVETEMLPGIKIIYLQLAEARYALYPAKKLYAEIRLDQGNNALTSSQVPSDFTPDKLISGTPPGAKYEKLGTEEINGRSTTKYRVTSGGDSKSSSETIVWADESLGMPIKVESTSKDGGKFTMELRDIKQEVDSSLFELPKDYRKVEHSELISSALPSVKDVLGIEDENKTGSKR